MAAMGVIQTIREFLVLTVKVLPFFLLGAVAGAAFQTLLSRKWPDRLFGGGGLRPLFAAVSAAALLPGCSCATMPMAAGLKDAGAPRLGTTTAFIFMSPLLSPVTVALTWSMLGWRMTAARVVASFVGSIAIGVIVNRFEEWFSGRQPSKTERASTTGGNDPVCGATCGDGSGGCAQGSPAVPRFGLALRGIFRSVVPYFLFGMLIAAALSALLPEEAIPRYLGGSSGPWAYLLAALVGIPLYVCEGEEVPITFALLSRGLGVGPSLTFLLGSVGTCIPTMLMSKNVIGRRATLGYIVFWFLFVIGSGTLFQLLVR
jgi:uncharacterized membrane protein YraQ (UPF0718 family)